MSKCRYDLSEDCHRKDCFECVLDKIRAEIEALNPVDYVSMSSYEGHRGASEALNNTMIEDIYEAALEKDDDAVSRQKLKEQMIKYGFHAPDMTVTEFVEGLPSVTPQSKTGHWLRMSDLSEQEDDRYKCSHCGNVVHYKNKMDLYTFNSWCNRCGSNNRRKIEEE